MSEEIKKEQQTEQNHAGTEDIAPDISDLQSEAINTRKLQAIALIAFMVVVLILLAFNFLHSRKKSDPAEEEAHIGTKIENKDLNFKPEPKKSFKELVLEKRPQMSEEANETENTPFLVKQKAAFEPKVYKGSSSVMITNSSQSTSTSAAQKEEETPPDVLSGEYAFDENGKLVKKEDRSGEKEYEGDVFAPKAAKLNQFDPNLYLAKGTYIGCSLNTRLVSTVQGGISCTVSEDVYSDNGVTLLIEKGSKITGSYRNGQMNDGMDRIFVVWQEIKTPNQVIIPVASGASDELGGAGIQGYVDHHWLERFGSAILLSIIDDATNVALNGGKGDRGNNNVDYTENSRATTQEMANTALEKFVNIEPTLYKNQGDIVGVYVNRDIDFKNVYRLKVRKGIRK